MPKIYFHPQSISNRDIQFQNGEKDKVKYSYTGSFTQKGVDYEEISLTNIYDLAKSNWDRIQMNNTTHEQKDRELFALRLKYFYVVRNFIALNNIIKAKNSELVEADKKWATDSTWVKVATFILKILSFCTFDLLTHLHNKYEKIQRHPVLRTCQVYSGPSTLLQARRFIEAMNDDHSDKKPCEKNKEFLANLRIKGKQVPDQLDDKIQLIVDTWVKLAETPQARLEDVFYLAKPIAGYDFESLYRMDLPNVFHSTYVNGHMVDPNYVPSTKPDEENGLLLCDFNNRYKRHCDPNVPRFFPQGSTKYS